MFHGLGREVLARSVSSREVADPHLHVICLAQVRHAFEAREFAALALARAGEVPIGSAAWLSELLSGSGASRGHGGGRGAGIGEGIRCGGGGLRCAPAIHGRLLFHDTS